MQLKALLFLSSISYSLWATAGLTEREKDDFVYDLSLATQGIMVSLVIVDSNNLVMNMPIVGQEFVTLKLQILLKNYFLKIFESLGK